MSAGYVYILFNAGLQANHFKIGLTTKTPKERARELSRATGVPKPFEVAYSIYVKDCAACERLVHQKLLPFHAGKEFFELPLDEAKQAVDESAKQVGVGFPLEVPPTEEHQYEELDFSTPKSKLAPVPFESHLPRTDLLGKEILVQLRKKVMAIGPDISEKATTYNRIAYSRGRVFLEVKVHKNRIRILFLDIAFNDPLKTVVEVPKSYGWGRLKYLVNLRSLDDLVYCMPYIEASYALAAKS